MKLLIITQKANKEDDVLGFVHKWIEKFATKFDFVNVICLKQGEISLPSNVKVWSLGKEEGESKIKYFFRFYKYIWKLRKDYDAVFVHMNPIYIVFGGIFWKIWNKKIYLWHNHQNGTWVTRFAIKMVNTAFCTSRFSFTSKFKKAKIMPAGIDIEIFKKDNNIQKIQNSVLYVGRVSRIKGIHILIEAVKLLDKEGIDFVLNIVGRADEEDTEYLKELKDLASDLEQRGKIKFLGKIPNYKTPEIYNQSEILVNLSPAGLFDKTILEAMACETIPLVSSKAFDRLLSSNLIFKEESSEDLKDKISNIFKMGKEEKQFLGKELRNSIVENHSLDSLIEKFVQIFKS